MDLRLGHRDVGRKMNDQYGSRLVVREERSRRREMIK